MRPPKSEYTCVSFGLPGKGKGSLGVFRAGEKQTSVVSGKSVLKRKAVQLGEKGAVVGSC